MDAQRTGELVQELNSLGLGNAFLERLFFDIRDQIDIIDLDEEGYVMLGLLGQASRPEATGDIAIMVTEYLLGVDSINEYLEEFLSEHRSSPHN